MPLTGKGSKILKSMQGEYGAKKGKSVFYASRNAGKISGVESMEAKLRQFHENMVRRHGRKK